MKFRFQAKSVDGKMQSGEVDAVDENDARTKVRAQQLIPLRIVASVGGQRSGPRGGQVGFLDSLTAKKVQPKDLQVFTRQFSTLINAGITVVDALKILGTGATVPIIKEAVNKVRISIENGKGLGDSMAQHPFIFDRLYCNMVKAGEGSGALETILNRLALYIEKSEKIKNQVKGAMFYPGAIITVSMIVISCILIFIIPKFQELYSSAKQDPPLLTQMVVNISQAMIHKWYLFVGSFVLGPIILKAWHGTEDGRQKFDQFFIHAPMFGPMVQKSAIARFTRTMSSLLASGIPLIDAIDVSAKTCGNYVIERTLMKAKEFVTQGKTFSAPLTKEKMIPGMVSQMISIGEQSGSLEAMLSKIADFYEDEVDNTIKGLTSMIEPILMVVLGGIIAVIVVAMYLPVFNMANVATGG